MLLRNLLAKSERKGKKEGTVNLCAEMKYIDELEGEKVLKARKSAQICVAMRPV